MSWNYRIFHRRVEFNDDPQDFYEIREAYYDDDGQVNAWSAEPTAPGFETQDELVCEVRNMLAASLRPVIEITPDGEALA